MRFAPEHDEPHRPHRPTAGFLLMQGAVTPTRVAIVAAIVVACSMRRASAQTAPASPTTQDYPLEITDRPIVPYPGMTTLDVSEAFPTYIKTTVDTTGNTRTTRTGFTDYRTPALSLGHAFGPLNVSVGLGQLAYAGMSLATGATPAVVSVSMVSNLFASSLHPDDYYDSQTVGVGHKVIIRPRHLAVYAGAGVSLTEYSATSDAGMTRAGHVVWLTAHATAELQLTHRLGLYLDANLGGPAAQSSNLDYSTVVGGDVQLRFALRKWDFYGTFSVSDVKSTPLPYLEFGFVKRWGM